MRNLRRRSVVRLSRRPSRIPRLETLEDRTLLNHGTGHHVIAQFDGALSSPTDTRQVDINLISADFTIQAGQTVFLGFLVKAVGGSTLDPAAVQVRTSGGAPVNPDVSSPDLAGRAQSLVLADVRLGGYRLTIAGERGTAGAFQLDVFLAGDADGNRAANFADRDLIHSLLGVTAGQSNYRPEADVDLDGRIDGYDNSLWARNHQNSTRVNPLTLTVGLGPRSLRLADGSLLTNVPASQVLGATAPRAQVSLERNSVPLGTATADAGGNYSIPIGLTEGINPIVVRAADTFGQRRSATAVLKLDTGPPTATSGLTGTVNTTVSFFDVFYSEPMDASAFRATNYALTVEGGPAHGQAVIISSVTEVNPSTARLTLAAALPDQGFKLVISSAVGDLADNRLAEPRTFLFTVADAVGIKEISPANGEEMVGLAREVIVRFDDRVDPLTVHATSFKVIANGQPLPGTIRVSATEMFATFFPTSPLPTSTGVRVVVEGVRGRDGLLVDGDGDTVPGGKATADFRTLPLARIAGTHLFGYVYDSFNRLPGGADRPIVGATIRVDAFPAANVITDANGYFELRDMPAPEFFVHIDGTTATNAPAGFGYPSVGKPFHSVPGQRVQLNKMGMPFHIYLPPMSMGDVLPLSPTQPTDVGFGAAGRTQLQALFPTVNPAVWDRMRVTYPPNSAVTNQGVPATQGIVIPVAPNRIPAPLPANVNPQLVVSIQAMDAQGGEVTNFDVPAPVTFPNLEGLRPGEKSLIFSFNHDAGRWDVIGAGTVSADGLTVVSDPGVGVRAPGWHFIQVGTETEGDPCIEGQVCVQVNGGLLGDVIEVNLSGTNGREFQLHSNSVAGKIAEFSNWEEVLRTSGKFYFVPNFPDTDTRFTQAPVTAQYTFSGIGRLAIDPPSTPERRLTFLVQIKEVVPGYSTSEQTGVLFSSYDSRGGFSSPDRLNPIPPESSELNVFRVQQRLKWLGFRGEKDRSNEFSPSPAITVDGDSSQTVFVQALKLFQAAIQADGKGKPAEQPGTVRPGDVNWLNADNAPLWERLDDDGLPLAAVINAEYWATTWTREVVTAAVRQESGIRISSLTEYPDHDWDGPGPRRPHARHKAGNDIDITLRDLLPIQAGTGTIVPTLPFNLNQPAISDDERAVVLWILAVTQAAGDSRIQDVFIGGEGGEPSYPRIHTILAALHVPNASTEPGHDDHIHVTLRPPGLGSSPRAGTMGRSDPPVSRALGFGSDPRLYYRVELSNGFEFHGRTNLAGNFSEVLSPDVNYTIEFYQATTNRSAIYRGRSSPSGVPTTLGTIILDKFGGPDADADGLPDTGERAIGTSTTLVDTDGDSISDSTEIAQGLDPLDNRGFPTGIISSLPLAGSAREVVVEGSTAYVATDSHGFAVVDVSRFNNPVILGQLDLPGTATDVAADVNLRLAAVAAGSGGLHFIDVADPMLPTLRRTISATVGQVEVINGVAYVTVGSTLRAYDLLTGDLLQSLSLFGSTLTGLAREGSFLYTMDSARRLRAIDIGGFLMAARGTVVLPNGGGKLFVGNGIAYAAAADTSQGGFATANVTNPDGLIVLSGTDAPTTSAPGTAVVTNGSGVGLLVGQSGRVTGRPSSLQLLNVNDPTNTYNFLLQIGLLSPPSGITVASGIAFVADGVSGLQVVNYLPFDNRGLAPTVTASTTVPDVDPGTPGIQVLEGTSVPVRAAIADDVQVRNAELLVNGQVVRNDVSFPFDFFAVAPNIAPGAETFTIQVRATDTGGNTTLSNVLTLGLVNDTFAPTIVSIEPPTNSSQVEPRETVKVRFSESMAAATLTAQTIRLRDGLGNFLAPTTFQLRNDDRFVQLTFTPLTLGSYEIVLSAAAITDRAGNALGAADIISPFSLTARASIGTTAVDEDPAAPGLQVFEGTTLPLVVNVVPGVAVQRVEFLFNGLVIVTDTAAPFTASAVAPNIAPGVNSFTLQARVTDTANFATLTNLIPVGLLEDVTPPMVTATNPADGGTTFRGVTIVQVTFSESMATATFVAANFALVEAGLGGLFDDGNDVSIPISAVQATDDDTTARLTVAALQPGLHRLRVSGAGVSDRAGNSGSGLFTSIFTVQDRPGMTELLNLPGTLVSGNLFLTSDKLTLAVNTAGSLIVGGTGLVFDGREFVIWGTPVWNHSLTFNGGIYANGGGMTAITRENLSSGTFHGMRFTGIAGGSVRFERVIGFFDGDEFALITTRLTNLTAAPLNNVATMENTDPDQGIALGLGFDTSNDVVLGGDLVRAHVTNAQYPGGLTMGYGSADPRAVTSAEGFSNVSPYDVINSPVDPNGAFNDIGINLALNFGTVAASDTVIGGLILALGRSTTQAEQTYELAAPLTLAGARLPVGGEGGAGGIDTPSEAAEGGAAAPSGAGLPEALASAAPPAAADWQWPSCQEAPGALPSSPRITTSFDAGVVAAPAGLQSSPTVSRVSTECVDQVFGSPEWLADPI